MPFPKPSDVPLLNSAIANLGKAYRDNQVVHIAGGEFSGRELFAISEACRLALLPSEPVTKDVANVNEFDVLVHTTYSEMQPTVDAMCAAQRGRLAASLQDMVLSAAWKSAYLDHRHGSGCGDQGHVDSVKHANKVLQAMRKAFGFTYPERGAINV